MYDLFSASSVQHRCNEFIGTSYTLIFSRLDYFLISQHLQETVIKSEILTSILSDHSPVSLSLKFLDHQQLGPGHWKLNVSLV